jgi:GntR family transcriptional regulator
MIEIDPASPVPLYRQIADQIRRLIALGALRAGEQIPAVRELAIVARVNRNTAARAVQYLESQGLVRTRVGQGTFVEEPGSSENGNRRSTAILDDLIGQTLVEGHTLGLTSVEIAQRLSRQSAEFERTRQERPHDRPVDSDKESE